MATKTSKKNKKGKSKTAASKNGAVSEEKAKFLAYPIKLLVKENPKRPGTESHKRFKFYSKCKTVGAFLKAGGTRRDLDWDYEKGFIKY